MGDAWLDLAKRHWNDVRSEPDRRIVLDPDSEADVRKLATALAADGEDVTPDDWMDGARAVLSALAEGTTSE